MSKKVENAGGINPYKVRFTFDGKQTSRRFRTYLDAARFAGILDNDGIPAGLDYLDEVQTRRPGMPTLTTWAKSSIGDRSGLGTGQRRDYLRIYDRTWKPLIGAMQLHQIAKADVSRALVELSERGGAKGQGLADKTCHNAFAILSGILQDAVDAGHLDKSPAKGVAMPRRTSHESAEMRFLSHDEFGALYDATPTHWRALVAFLAGTGCRWGEASALLVRDVDLENGVVRISRAVKWNGNNVGDRVIGPPKTRGSKRTVALPPELVPILAPLVVGQHSALLVFRAVNGGPAHHAYFYPKVWRPTIKRAGLDEPRLRIHDLRHTHVAWLVAAKVNLPTIQKRLGHESIKTTIDRYGHLSPDQDAEAARAVFAGMVGVAGNVHRITS